MPLKILLVSVNRCKNPYPVFPLGVAHIAAAVERVGHEVLIIDCASDASNIAERTVAFMPDYIGLSLRNIDDIRIRNNQFFADDLTTITKTFRTMTIAPIILGGSGFSLFPQELLKNTGADFGIASEGEESFVALLDALEHKKPFQHIPGLVYRDPNTIITNPVASCNPSSILVAKRPQHLIEYYRDNTTMLNVQTQRGCAIKCCYCTYPLIEGHRVRTRDAHDVVDELEELKSHGVRYVFIVDSVFNSCEKHVVNICEELISRNIVMSWGCFLKPTGLTQDTMNLMAKAGLTHIEFGSDSLCDSVLFDYQKGFTFDDIYHASEFARLAKVHYAHFLITGGPGESEATMREGFENSKRLKKTAFFPFVGMRIYPKTYLYKRAIQEKKISESTDLLSPVFYISSQISEERIFALLTEFTNESPNWIIGELPPEKARIVDQLRKKGVEGPLWEFIVR